MSRRSIVISFALVCVLLFALLLVGCGPRVPDVKGMPAVKAVQTLQAAGFKLGTVLPVFTPGLTPNTVAAQSPTAGQSTREGSAIDLWIAQPLGEFTVPNIVGQNKDAAASMIASASMTSTPVGAYSDTAPSGQVIAQSPSAGTKVGLGEVVVFQYSLGKAPATVAVPKLVGQEQAFADATLKDAGLVSAVFKGYSDTVASGLVAGQDPAAGTKVKPGSKVGYLVSLGKAPSGSSNVSVPNVKGKSQADAEAAIQAAGLVANVVKGEASAAKGTVAGQMPPAGSKTAKGGIVGILVSTGESQVTVPSVKGKSKSDAIAAIEDAGLVPYSTGAPSADVPEGDVIDQAPPSGESVPPGSPVTIVVSTGTPPLNSEITSETQ